MRCNIDDISFRSALFAYAGIELGAKVQLSRIIESADKIISRHLRMLLYDNSVDADLTALWRNLIRINAI